MIVLWYFSFENFTTNNCASLAKAKCNVEGGG